MSDASKKRVLIRRMVTSPWFIYEIVLLCLVIALTNRQKLRKMRGIQMHKRKDGQSSGQLVWSLGVFVAAANQVKFQGFQFPITPVLDKVFDVLTPQLSIMRTTPLADHY
jgi:hypothetical protein